MLKKIKTSISHQANEIKFLNQQPDFKNIFDIINQQIYYGKKHDCNVLQKIQPGIFLLSLKKPLEPLKQKKLSDQAQYAILPNENAGEHFYKISFNNLKNQCHIFGEIDHSPGHNVLEAELIFYFELSYLEKLLNQAIEKAGFFVRETLTNRTMVISDGQFNYPMIISKVPSLAIWRNEDMSRVVEKEISLIKTKGKLCQKIFLALKNIFKLDWELEEGLMSYSLDGRRSSFDYISLVDDFLFLKEQPEISDLLQHLDISDLDSSSFPTVSIRSPLHLKARPSCLSQMENGYAIVASKESLGLQTVINTNKGQKAFSLWLKRAFRHIPRHRYQARVIFSDDQTVFSLVGEQVASIALFPALLKGVFDALDLEAPKSVRLIAHSEDVITVAHDTASWVEINNINKKATTLFRMVCLDGCDPLSLFEQILLPKMGVGNFKLQTVPEQFFELINTAKSLKYTMPPGHDHYLVGLAYQCVHEWGLSVTEIEKALRLDADDPDILHALGCALMEIGRVKDAMPFLKRAFDLMPEDAEVANNWGRTSLECGEITQAIKAFERAVRLSPGSADYLKNLGDGYLLAARPHEALDIFNMALRCDPFFAEAHATLAHLHLEIGDEGQAQKHALLAYKENPADTNIATLLWRLTGGKK